MSCRRGARSSRRSASVVTPCLFLAPGAPAGSSTRGSPPVPIPKLGPPQRGLIGPAPDLGCVRRVWHACVPRKEVIQPQLPLRLPCYDFVPITSPTLDGCASCEFAHRLQVLPAFVT